MAHFIAAAQGRTSEVTRLGTREGGASARVQGWNIGIKVRAYHENGIDKIDVYATGGSNGALADRLIATVTRDPEGGARVINVEPRKVVAA